MVAYSLTDVGQGKGLQYSPLGSPYFEPKALLDADAAFKTLNNLNLNNIPVGSRAQEVVCQQLESAWLDWSSAIDHLGAVQFFCDMIDPVLDVKIDSSIVKACRGNVRLNGQVLQASVIDTAKEVLVRKKYRSDAEIVSQRLKDLQCPLPAVSVMN